MAGDSIQPKGKSPAPSRSGRPAVLSRERILSEAAQIQFEDQSFSLIASRLGVSTQALYRYFSNLSELQSVLVSSLVASLYGTRTEVPWSSDGETDFPRFLFDFANDFGNWLREEKVAPDLLKVQYGSTRFPGGDLSPTLFAVMNYFLAVARDCDVSLDDASAIYCILVDFMTNTQSVRIEEDFVEEFSADLSDGVSELGIERFPRILEYLEIERVRAPGGSLYEVSLRALIAGLCLRFDLGRLGETTEPEI